MKADRHVALLAVFLLLAPRAAFAVKEGVFSRTAEACAAFRAIGARNPDAKLRNPDHLAEKLVSPSYWSSVRFREHSQVNMFSTRNAEGLAVYFYVNARTHYVDGLLGKALGDKVTQVVILGAGLDSRAYRFGERFPGVRFYEVDLPWVIEEKKSRVREMLGREPPAQVVYVGLDFNRQTLDAALPAAGYDPSRPAFFVLEGITMYVSASGNEATFRFIGKAAPGSSVVYDYVLERVVRGDFSGIYGARVATSVKEAEEPFVTGWTPESTEAFLSRLGLTKVEDLGEEELTERFLVGSDGRLYGRPGNGGRVVHARVK